jgi:hypothetical protein
VNTNQLPKETTSENDKEPRSYEKPAVTDLGDVRELTRGTGGTKFDGPLAPATHT